jgi:hypothetical protein
MQVFGFMIFYHAQLQKEKIFFHGHVLAKAYFTFKFEFETGDFDYLPGLKL